MWKARVAGVVALIMVGTALTGEAAARNSFRPASGVVLTEGHIAHLHAVLHLTAAQEKHWPAVAAALHSVIRQQHQQKADAGFQLASAKPRSIDSGAVQRVMSAAMPLVMTLNDEQKRHAQRFARSLGLDSVASAL
jgi:hypothetical protein